MLSGIWLAIRGFQGRSRGPYPLAPNSDPKTELLTGHRPVPHARQGHSRIYAARAVTRRYRSTSLPESLFSERRWTSTFRRHGFDRPGVTAILRAHKPEWLYELLPYVYVGVGVLTMASLQNLIALVSGGLLISAGAVVWLMRRRYRSGQSRVEANAAPSAATAARVRPVLPELSWRNAFDGAYPEIDEEHRVLIKAGNAVIRALAQGRDRQDIELMLYEFLDQFEKHCELEADFLSSEGRPLDADNVSKRNEAMVRVRSLEERYHSGEVPIDMLVSAITHDLMLQHILE